MDLAFVIEYNIKMIKPHHDITNAQLLFVRLLAYSGDISLASVDSYLLEPIIYQGSNQCGFE
jgi:hypothetical protein